MTAFAQEAATLEIPITIELKGKVPSTPEDLAVVLTAKETANPMPEGAANGSYTMTVAGSVTQNFPVITYTRTGIYHYTIHQEKGTNTKGTYDTNQYYITVSVTNVEDGADALAAAFVVHAGTDDTQPKSGEIKFSNSYKSSGGGGGGGNGGGGGTPSGGDPSGGPGVTTIEDGEPPLTTILPFDVPLALPQTGTLWWLAAALAAVGGVLFLGGLIKNRRHEDDDI